MLGGLVPLGKRVKGIHVDGLDLFAEGRLGLFVLALHLLAGFEEALVALVHLGRGILEAIPQLLAQLLGHGADAPPLVVKQLQLLEGGHHVVVGEQGFGGLAQSGFLLEVLLEVVVAQLLVNLQQVVEVLDASLETLPQARYGSRGKLAGLFEGLLQLLEAGILLVDIVRIGGNRFHLFQNLLLAGQILLALFLERGGICGLFLAEYSQQRFERLFLLVGCGDELRLGVTGSDESIASLFYFDFFLFIIGLFQFIDLFLHLFNRALNQLSQLVDNLFSRKFRSRLCRILFLLGGSHSLTCMEFFCIHIRFFKLCCHSIFSFMKDKIFILYTN